MSKEKEFFLKEFINGLAGFLGDKERSSFCIIRTVYRRTIYFTKEGLDNGGRDGIYDIAVKDKNDKHVIDHFHNIQTITSAIDTLDNVIDKAIEAM